MIRFGQHSRTIPNPCPKCDYPLDFRAGRALCSECGCSWIPADLRLAARVRSARKGGVVVLSILSFVLILVVYLFQVPGGRAFMDGPGEWVVRAFFLGVPIWSLPIAWWSFCAYQFATRQAPAPSRVDAVADFVARWILTMLTMGVAMAIAAVGLAVVIHTIMDLL